jgi:hypothetical protein
MPALEQCRLKRIWLYLAHVGFPLAVGGGIYLYCRAGSLAVFSALGLSGFGELVIEARGVRALLLCVLPEWAIYSLPDGVWVYSWTAYMLLLWAGKTKRGFSKVWPHTGLCCGLGSEWLQLLHKIPGRFDVADTILYVVFYGLALTILACGTGVRTVKPDRVNLIREG